MILGTQILLFCVPVGWFCVDATTLQKKSNAVKMSFGSREVKRRSAVKVTNPQIVTQKHVPETHKLIERCHVLCKAYILPSQLIEVSVGGSVHHADDGVALALVHDPARVDFAGEPLGVVVAMEVENLDEFLAEGEASDRVAKLVDGRRVDADAHRVGQDQHHAAGHGRLAGKTHLQK